MKARPEEPSSLLIGASSQKLAARPPPRSSVPLKPRRLELEPEFARLHWLCLLATPVTGSREVADW